MFLTVITDALEKLLQQRRHWARVRACGHAPQFGQSAQCFTQLHQIARPGGAGYSVPSIIGVQPDPPNPKGILMAGERELTTGLLSKDASFRLIVRGNIGVKEIERLIKKLELDKEILADQENDEAAN